MRKRHGGWDGSGGSTLSINLECECVTGCAAWYHISTGSITPFGVEQKANIIVTLVEIMLTFWLLQNVIRILNLDSLLHCCKCWTKVNFGQNLDNILSGSKDKIMFGFCSTQYSVIM
jgi:hypothetical protein